MRNHLCLDWHMVYHIWLQRNASIHQGRLFFEEVMVKMIKWEVKNNVECNSYYNSIQNIWGYFMFCIINGPCLPKLTDLEISFCNIYDVV